MRRQQMVATRSHGGRNFILFLLAAGLVVFAVQDPAGAAAFVRGLVSLFAGAIEGIATFVEAVA